MRLGGGEDRETCQLNVVYSMWNFGVLLIWKWKWKQSFFSNRIETRYCFIKRLSELLFKVVVAVSLTHARLPNLSILKIVIHFKSIHKHKPYSSRPRMFHTQQKKTTSNPPPSSPPHPSCPVAWHRIPPSPLVN